MTTSDATTGWETSAHPLTNASEIFDGQVENRPGRVEFYIGYIRDHPVQASAKIFSFPACTSEDKVGITTTLGNQWVVNHCPRYGIDMMDEQFHRREI